MALTAPGAPENSARNTTTLAHGRWPKGVSGNPGGRPPIPALLRGRGEEALRYLVDVATGVIDADPALRVRCAIDVVDRCYGKASVAVEVRPADPPSPALLALLALVAERS